MTFLHGNSIYKAIKKITNQGTARCAVAFWGKGSTDLFPKDRRTTQLVCNLKMGGTNPFEIERLLKEGFSIRQSDTLHAKVYIGTDTAIVTSANASANGLGLEGREIAAWEEAGVLVDDAVALADVSRWFDDLWNKKSKPIETSCLKSAKDAWRARQKARPSLDSIRDFEIQRDNLPLLDPYGHLDWDINQELQGDLSGPAFSQLKHRVDDGIDIGSDEDRLICTPGAWVLWYQINQAGLPDRRSKPSWIQIGEPLEEAFRFEGETKWRPVALKAETQGKEPFPIDTQTREAFYSLMSEDRFKALRDVESDEAWFTKERLKLIEEFWKALRDSVASANS